MNNAEHPSDFSSYIDGDTAHPSYASISAHLQSCAACRDQVRAWRSVDAMFRSPELQIDVPASQWFRIRARMDEPRPASGWLEHLSSLTFPRQLALGLTMALFMLLLVTTGVRQFRNAGRQQVLTAIAQYGQTEEARLKTAENPFRFSLQAAGNPFTTYQVSKIRGSRNPFAFR